MEIYALGEDYLEAILILQKKNGMVRSIDLARHMEVSKSSVSHAVKTLRECGFLTMDALYFQRWHLPYAADGTSASVIYRY